MSRSYGVKLPSSLTRFNPIALEYSSHSPESVYGTSNFRKHAEAFLGSMVSANFGASPFASGSELCCGFAYNTSYTVGPQSNKWPNLSYSVPPALRCYRSRNINRVAIDYATWPRLRSRLTLRRIILAQEPLSFRRRGFSPLFERYLREHDHFWFVQPS